MTRDQAIKVKTTAVALDKAATALTITSPKDPVITTVVETYIAARTAHQAAIEAALAGV